MNRKFLIRLAPLLAIAAFAVVPAAAQGAKYFKAGAEIPVGEHVPTLSWGTLTLTPNPAVAPATTCENVVGGFVTNGAETGEGATSNFATYNCVNAGCPPGKVKIGEGEFEKEFVVVATKLPWPSTLIEEEGIRVNSTGVQVSLGCVAHGLSNTSPPGGTDTRQQQVRRNSSTWRRRPSVSRRRKTAEADGCQRQKHNRDEQGGIRRKSWCTLMCRWCGRRQDERQTETRRLQRIGSH